MTNLGWTRGMLSYVPCPFRPQGLAHSPLTCAMSWRKQVVRWPLRCKSACSFETLLAELSATFVNLPAGQVDSQIVSALQRLVVFLGLDRGGLAELLVDKKQLVITHSYHLPGVPPHPRTDRG